MNAFIIIDMQRGSFEAGTDRFETNKTVENINHLSNMVRAEGGQVIFIQHAGETGSLFEPGTWGFEVLPSIERKAQDITIRKKSSDAFFETNLQETLLKGNYKHLIVSGCATDFCVDTFVRSAMSKYFDVTVAGDAHTTADRPHLKAEQIIAHHNFIWNNFELPAYNSCVKSTQEILKGWQ